MEQGFILNAEKGYFRNHGVDVMAFDDFYPEGHQSGVSILMHGKRIATNGDIRFEQTPGQWQPVPKKLDRKLNTEENTIEATLRFPDEERHLNGFNPMIYPDYCFTYKVRVKGEKEGLRVTVDMDRPIPEFYAGKLCFNLELFPGELLGRSYMMDGEEGIFPLQPNGPTFAKESYLDGGILKREPYALADYDALTNNRKGYNPYTADDLIALPYAAGHKFTLLPEDPLLRVQVESTGTELKLYDGRMNHANGWFVLSSEIPAGKAEGAVEWFIRPHVEKDWLYTPVIQIQQVGYHPAQKKTAVIEMDERDMREPAAELYKMTENGLVKAQDVPVKFWGNFLRYRYFTADFSEVKESGMYELRAGGSTSSLFRIAENVYDRGVWQPVLEYFLPIQMCHMRVQEKYRIRHDLCHTDDAKMAPVNYNHFDGYAQGPETLTKYKPGEHVPGLDRGGWHDAADYDLRIESQAGECYALTEAFEEFGVYYDETSIDQEKQLTEIHCPDGKNDILQQIEHGLISIIGGYKSMGRLYRGIICGDLNQYVLSGDSAATTKQIVGDADDRWVFTEDNPDRELRAGGFLAASARAMRGYNDELSIDTLKAAEELFAVTRQDEADSAVMASAIFAACELLITTGDDKYRQFILAKTDVICGDIQENGWIVSKVFNLLCDNEAEEKLLKAYRALADTFEAESRETPYGIPYRPEIWGAGWTIQRQAFRYYFLHQAFPEIFGEERIFSALEFVLGRHPGSNKASFASGIGTESVTVAVCLNRADWSYIPGGVVSGTGLIRPDFPELLTFPYLWQQVEYVLGGGSSHYMFLVLAVMKYLGRK